MVFLWVSFCVPIVFQKVFQRFSMVYPWLPCGFPLVSRLLLGDFLRFSYALLMMFLLNFLWVLLRFLMISRGFRAMFPCSSHDILWIFSCWFVFWWSSPWFLRCSCDFLHWFSHDFPLILQWFPDHGLMLCQWFSYDCPAICLRFSCGFLMMLLWFPMIFQCCSFDFPCVFLWFSYDFAMIVFLIFPCWEDHRKAFGNHRESEQHHQNIIRNHKKNTGQSSIVKSHENVAMFKSCMSKCCNVASQKLVKSRA